MSRCLKIWYLIFGKQGDIFVIMKEKKISNYTDPEVKEHVVNKLEQNKIEQLNSDMFGVY